MPARKKQHYVPRFYLKNFSNSLEGKSIGIFNIETEKFIPAGNLRGQAYKDYFYGKDGKLEDALGRIEGSASKIINNIIESKTYPVKDSEEHIIILTFTIFLQTRTQYAVDQGNEMADKIFKTIFYKDERLKDSVDDIKINIRNAPQNILGIAAMCIPITFDLSYKILYNKCNVGLLTSDNPVVFYNQFLESRKTIGSNVGFSTKGLQIFLPISPLFAIIFYDGGVYAVGNKKDKIIELHNDSDITQLNCLQILNSNDIVYFNESLSQKHIIDMFRRIKKNRRKAKAFVHEYPGQIEQDGRMRSLILSHGHDIRIGLNLSFIRVIKRAKKYEVGNKAVHIRNERMHAIQSDFIDLVNRGIYAPNQFMSFLKDRGIRPST